jgi:EAL domain-containing protein (putative c-di-GMP-specific phosphodiesterase class I)
LRTLGCDVGQGYLLSRPLEAADLAQRFGVKVDVGSRPPS